MAGDTKAKYWTGVLYPENMVDDWQTSIGDLLQTPYAYTIHDKDNLAQFDSSKGYDERKTHVHVVIVFNNTTTYKNAFNVLNSLSAPGKQALSKIERVHNIRHIYEYLIHNTDDSRKKGKYQYDSSERITGNNFDIGSFEQLSSSDKFEIIKDISRIICENKIYNFADLNFYILENCSSAHFEILVTHSGYFERITKGNYQHMIAGQNHN